MISRLAKRRSATSPSAVCERLKQLILDEQIAPADPLPEEELASTFRVGRNPVHEALARIIRERGSRTMRA
jgi:DNA-binding GntR family transcriptional regulator